MSTLDLEKHRSVGDVKTQVQSSNNSDLFVADGRADGVDDTYELKVAMVNDALQNEVGMGRYQWQLFVLSGFGWAVDNLYFQGVAVILPQVSLEFQPQYISMMTLSLSCGLITGATVWGFMADILGRKPSWNATLGIAGVFGIAAGAAPSFPVLGVMLAFLGFGVGGNLPVDGALFIEFIPASHQWLLTLLSIFWSLGQLIASLIAWGFIANFSCLDAATCTKENNMGWRYTMYTLGGLTCLFFIARFFIFDIQESPKFLIAKGRDAEAIKALSHVAKRNGRSLKLTLEMLQAVDAQSEKVKVGAGDVLKKQMVQFDLDHVKPLFKGKKMAINTSILITLWGLIGIAYPLFNAFLPIYLAEKTAQIGNATSISQTYRDYSIISVMGVPGSIIACIMVESKSRFFGGRRLGMAISTLLTGTFLFLFTTAKTESAVLGWNCATSLTQNAMYGVLYAYTPEVFPAPHRGTGDGICSTFNRICGISAPLIKAFGATSNPDAPLFISASLFLVSSVLMALLPIETAGVAAL